jgi:type I restriction enzyme, S subunit
VRAIAFKRKCELNWGGWMASEWHRIRLRDLCTSIKYGLTASASSEPVGPKFLRITDIVPGSVDWTTVPYVKTSDSDRSKYALRPGDIVIARTGATTGYSACILDPPESVFASYLVRFVVSQEHNPRFIGYLLKGRQWWDYVNGVLGDKSAQPNASATTLADALLDIPDRATQDGVAEVLGALDDKIECNRTLRRSLRSYGQALFEQATESAAVETSIGELTVSLARGVVPRYTASGLGVLVLNQKCIRDGWVLTEAARWMEDLPVKDSKRAHAGDVVVNSTGVGTLGRVARWLGPKPVIVDGHITVVRPDASQYPSTVFGYAMLAAQPQIEALGEGSTGQTELSRGRLQDMRIRLPSLAEANRIAGSLQELDGVHLSEGCDISGCFGHAVSPRSGMLAGS